MSDIFHWLVVKKIIDLGKKDSKESGQRQPQLDNQLFCIVNFSSGKMYLVCLTIWELISWEYMYVEASFSSKQKH